ncbi:hypothetical protein ACHABX_03135 [Nesterenkonia halotolerans]|uniref:hypothetical protein n=1 Tax=Nesterenkonia halotolerans TaxID=225325 RepID=UPI003EE42464
MKHLHYGPIVIAISDQLALTFQRAAQELMAAGRSAVWPVSGYRDDREEMSIHLAVGPGIAFAVTDTWLQDDRPPSTHDSDSIAFIESEQESLEKEQVREGVQNVLIHGRFARDPSGSAGEWRFSGHPAVTGSRDPQSVVGLLNREDIEVLNVSEVTAPSNMAGGDLYILGRYIGEPLE